MDYKAKNFSRCVFNPTEKNLTSEYPDLKQISSDEKLLRYIIALYDPGSPIIPLYRDIKIRKEIAADFAGYERTDTERREALFELKDDTVREAVIKFLTTFAFPREWYMICANEQTFFEFGERMMKPIEKKDGEKDKDEISAIQVKSKLSEEMEKLSQRIEAGYRKVFGSDDSLGLPENTGRTTVEMMAGKV